MSAVAKSVFYFSFYLMLAGLGLFFIPNQILPLLGLSQAHEPWVHLAGALTLILGIFFWHMARKNSREFFFISMFGRGTFIAAIIIVVLCYQSPPALLLFAAIDLIGLIWTLGTYRAAAN